MTLAYIEDEEPQRKYVAELINKWSALHGEAVSCSCFGSAEEFLFKWEPEQEGDFPFDLILIDIAMKEMNGLELARRIRRYDRQVSLAFLTADRDFAIDGYEVGAVRYLLKPVDGKKLTELLEEVLSALHSKKQQDRDYVWLESSGFKKRIYISDVLYVEAVGHYTCIRLAEESIEVKANFSSICDLFTGHQTGKAADSLVRCHRSFLVNLRHVQRIGRDGVFLTGGLTIPVSRSAYKEVNEAFLSLYRDSL